MFSNSSAAGSARDHSVRKRSPLFPASNSSPLSSKKQRLPKSISLLPSFSGGAYELFDWLGVKTTYEKGRKAMNGWKSIFMLSPVNNAYYEEDGLPQQNWQWPKGTWFQQRLDCVRERQSVANLKSTTKTSDDNDMRAM
jgi:hypothetical protein